VHNCSSFPDRAIVLGARHATYDTCQPIGWTIGGDPNPGASSHVALCAGVASSGDNHFDRCDLLHHRIIHDSARKDLAGCASPSDGPDAGEIGPGWDPPKCPNHQAWVGALEQTSWVCRPCRPARAYVRWSSARRDAEWQRLAQHPETFRGAGRECPQE
jgi:hypothetical protein